MDRNTTIRELIATEFGVRFDEVTEDADFINDLGGDSLEKVQLIMDLEHVFGLIIPDHDADGLRCYRDVVQYVEKHSLSA